MILSQTLTLTMLPQSPGDVLRECQERESSQAPRCSASSCEIAGIMVSVSRDPLSF